ncbi:MAG: hypothetical protein Q9163_001491 [Psora crenata]
MATQKAIEIKGPGDAQFVMDRRMPQLRDDYILIKTVAVALNPTDWKHIDSMATPGALSGCDYAGVVQEIGEKVKKPLKKGDRVCGMCHGANRLQLEDGAFAEYIVAKGDIQMTVPPQMTLEEAATLGVGIFTVVQSLYQSLQLPLPSAPAEMAFPVLIYGGSTATGTLAIQFAKLSGLTVITTCSPRNNDLVKRLGADAVFDHNDVDCGQNIRAYTSNTLMYALDCISQGSSVNICANALSTLGGPKNYSSLLGVSEFPRRDVEQMTTLAYSAIGEEMSFQRKAGVIPPKIPAKVEDARFMEVFIPIAEALLAHGKIKAHPPRVREAGLRGILDGLQDMREGKVSGEKLVYRVADTL